jgi:Fe-S-cluster-containing dehydrogenase component
VTASLRDPARLFSAPLLRVLDERGRHDVAAAGLLRRGDAGHVFYCEGEAADAFFVVLSGEVQIVAPPGARAASRILRGVSQGGVFGEEACELGAERRSRAVSKEPSSVFQVPMSTYRRAALRCGATRELEREERTVARTELRDRLLALDCVNGETALELLLDGGALLRPGRGLRLYGAGDAAGGAFLVLEGYVELLSAGDKPRVQAYLTPGDVFGHDDGTTRSASAVPLGSARLLSLPPGLLAALAREAPEFLTRADRHRGGPKRLKVLQDQGDQRRTRLAVAELDRLTEARSLLAIDLELCVRCGHCSSACASHHDGVSRLVRQGAKVATALGTKERSLLLPNSCQHCTRPSCLPECPTGAIGRGPDGEVFIREELCTGCGACARACPWENIQMVPRPGAAPVATKCDLCAGFEAPACVHACPTSALTRAAPESLFAEVGALRGGGGVRSGVFERTRRSRWLGTALFVPLVALCVVLAGLVLAAPARAAGSAYVTGSAAGLACLGLLTHALRKRWRARRSGAQKNLGEHTSSRLASWLRGHVVLGVLAPVCVLAHAGLGRGGTGSALALCFWICAALGLFTALAYRLIPRRLTRIERRVVPHELRGREKSELEDRLHAAVSKGGPVAKKLFEGVLAPYLRSTLSPLLLLVSGRSLAEEERRLSGRIEQLLGGRGQREAEAMREQLGVVIELAARPARALLERVLVGSGLAHALLAAMFAVLLVLHVVGVLR